MPDYDKHSDTDEGCAEFNDRDHAIWKRITGALAALAVPAAGGGEELEQMRARKDAAYLERNRVVAALARCYPSGIARTAIEGWDAEWHGCVYIDLPTGQVSWHYHDDQAFLFEGLPAYSQPWDGHDTDEKYHRLEMLKFHKPPLVWTTAAVQAERERCAKVAESMIVFSGEQGRLRASIAQAIRQEGEAS